LIGLCEILAISSVAEHVESDDLLELVMELGCTAGQPASARAWAKWL
jgi:EAL domain-containing protein (putative c-di-GMP-specific phosphodiesterase class I)